MVDVECQILSSTHSEITCRTGPGREARSIYRGTFLGALSNETACLCVNN